MKIVLDHWPYLLAAAIILVVALKYGSRKKLSQTEINNHYLRQHYGYDE